jgi:MFS family permease
MDFTAYIFFKSTKSDNSTIDLEVPLLLENNADQQEQYYYDVKEFHEPYKIIGPPKRAFIYGNGENAEDDHDSSQEVSIPRKDKTPSEEVSRNIPLIIAYTYFLQTSRSLWSNNILSSYVYLLKNNSPEAVGFITAIMGMSQVLVAFPAGHAADKYGRDRVLRLGSLVGFISISILCFAVYKQNYSTLAIALAASGVFMGITSPCTMALLADSIREGQRAKYFTHNLQVTRAGQMFGPILALALFSFWGDKWEIEECSWVLAIGQFFCIPAIILLCYMKDDYAVSDAGSRESTGTTESINSLSLEEDEELSLSIDTESLTIGAVTKHSEAMYEHSSENIQQNPECQGLNNNDSDEKRLTGKRFISIAVATSDTIQAVASGMTIRYFPIFFMKSLNLHPTQVQILYIVAPLGQIIAAHFVQKATKKYGLLEPAVICRLTGILFMFAMMYSYQHMDNMPFGITPSTSVRLTCVLYVLRTIFMNCTSGLTKGVLMDSVPKEERGKWSALESFNTATWSGSSFVGGILVGIYGISVNFYVTSIMQFVATLPLMLLFNRVSESREPETISSSDSSDENKPDRDI